MKKFNLSKGLIVGLLTFALSIVAFAAVGASADEAAAATPTKSVAVAAEYNAADDTVKAGSNAYVYVVKAASGNKIKAGTSAAGQLAAGKIKIADLGIKGTKKDVFLYVCDKEVEVEETVAANLTIKGNANKVVGAIDYTQADLPGSAKVLSAYYVDKSTKKQVDIASEKLYWSADQETWYLANSDAVTTRKDSKGQATKDGFLGKDLAEMLEAGGLIYVKQAGTDGGATAQFGSAVAKVKIAKQAKAPKVKIDVAKDTIALKNGFDFAVATKNNTTNEYTEYGDWYTILPVLKTATVTEGIVGGEDGGVYAPLDKKDANAGKKVTVEEVDYYSYTKKAYKVLSIDTLLETLGSPDGDFKIAVRKSATNKKPASAVTTVEIGYKADAPLVYTKDNVKGEFVVSTAEEFSKKGLSFGDITAYPGYKEIEDAKVLATTGFDKTFAIVTGNDVKEADEGSTFEYLVVDGKNYFAAEGSDDAIDWTTAKWKKFDPAKLKINEKLAGAYSTVKGKKIKTTLKAESAAVADGDSDGVTWDEAAFKNVKTILLVHRAGDKSSSKRASEAIELYVVKNSSKSWSLYSTVSNGEIAYKHTIKFAKWTKTGENWGWKETDEPANIVLWMQKGDAGKQYIDLPAVTDAVLYTASEEDDVITLGNAAVSVVTAEGANKGKYEIALARNEDETTWMIVREYANIKVKVQTQIGTDNAVDVAANSVTVAKGKVGNAGSVTCYVGAACEVGVTAPDTPTKTGFTVTAANPDYVITPATGVGYADDTVTVTPNSADEVEITLTFKYTATETPALTLSVAIKDATNEADVTDRTLPLEATPQQIHGAAIVAIATASSNNAELTFTWEIADEGIITLADAGAHSDNPLRDSRTITPTGVGSTTITVTVSAEGAQDVTDSITVTITD